MIEIVAGERPRMDALDRDLAGIKSRADAALRVIEQAIDDNPTTGQARRRGLDTRLANACLDYLNYDRLGIAEVHKHLAGGDRGLHRWLEQCGIEPVSRIDR